MTQHAHTCEACGASIPCSGRIVQNWDGFPPALCIWDTEIGMRWLCEDCHALPPCDYCGEPNPYPGTPYCSGDCQWLDHDTIPPLPLHAD